MTPKFSKALLAAGLAAALVGCGGGSSTATIPDNGGGGSMTETTSDEVTALDGTYATANDLVGKLSADSTPAQFKEARDARTALLNQLLAAGDDVSSEKRTDLNTKLTTLENAIMAAEKARDEKAAAAQKIIDDKRKEDEAKRVAGLLPNAWYKAVKDHDPINPGTFAPDNVLVGTKTNVTGLPEGWKGTNYEYEEGTTNEQGKTFKKTVTRMTPEITMRWDEVALEAAKTNRNSVINDYLGGSRIKIEAISSGIGITSESFASTSLVQNVLALGTGVNTTAADSINLAGSGIVYEVLTGRRLDGPDTASTSLTDFTTGANVFTENDGDYIIKTSFHRDHFEEVDANFLAGLTNNPVAWKKDATHIEFLETSPNPVYIKWRGIPVHVTMVTDSASTSIITARFNKEGYLEIVPVVTSGQGILTADRIAIVLRPVDPNNISRIATQNIHTMPLMVRPESTKTATTELAYWASTMKDNTKVTLKTWAEGMDFGPVTDMPEKLTGSAEYHGLAAGYYAIGKVGEESHGEFTADAMLTANFGTNMVNGTIKGFETVTGGADLSPWSLTLNSASFINDQGTDDMTDDVFKTFTGRTVSNGGMLGHWKGEFLGKANPGTDLESAADMTNDYPEAVVGNFTGHFDNKGHVAGAFGVELHDDNKE